MKKILVPVKRVVDYNIKVRPKSDGSDVDIATAKMSMNPFDEIAIEEAIRLKEKGTSEEITAISIGPTGCAETLRTALALGADKAIHVTTNANWEPINIAKILKKIIERDQYDAVIMGKQAIDDDSNQTGQMLAALLDWPQGTFTSKLEPQNGKVKVTREVDGGLETIALTLPAVITTDLRLNEPRYATLPNIMKAKQKPLEQIELGTLGIDLSPHITQISVSEPPTRQAGIKVKTVDALLDKLKNEAKVL